MPEAKEYYKMLTPEFKYPRVFCSEEEIMMAKTFGNLWCITSPRLIKGQS
ncbi:hypothetical protein [Desulfurella sp.]|nr:hypothetical protein [Desulfurella sp.]